MKINHKIKGFTLTEMLIAILLIALLSAIVAFSSVTMTKTAEASRIINNLYSLKNAVLLWRRDNLERIDKNGKIDGADVIQKNTGVLAEIAQYLDAGSDFEIKTKDGTLSEGGQYGVFYVTGNNKSAWYVGYHLTFAERYSGIREKIRTQGKSMNIWIGGNSPTKVLTKGELSTLEKKEEKGVWLKVLGDNDWEKN